ncbi:COGC-3 protein, partial [Aphelenchoides avenae]
MFGELHRQTLDILAERAENYLFDDAEDTAEEPPKEEKCNVVSAQALFNTLKATYDLEENINEMEENAQVLALRRCMDKVTALQAQKSTCEENLHELQSKYNAVTDKTSSLHNACDRMMSQQTQLAAGTEQLKTNLHYYQQYDWIMKKLQTSKLSLSGTLFAQILSSIHECMSYLKANPEHKEAETYLRKYEHCLSRALSAIKLGVMTDLESCKNEVLYRQAKASSQPTAADGAVGMTYADDDTFALLYGVFGVKANAVRNAVSLGHQYFSEYPEFQSMVMECEEAYFQIREHLLRPIVNATVQQLSQKHKESSCTFTRDGCNFLLRLADDEYRLYKQFFVVRSADGSGSKSVAASPPMTPRPAFFWQQSSFTFDSFIEGLCQILYDALRPLIIHNQHLETLAQLCTHLKIEMIEERCGMLMSAIGTDDEPEEAINPRAGFARVMSGLVGDIVERIVYRTSLYAQSDILSYNPAHGDLTYPERLLMMKDIENKSVTPATPDTDPSSSAPLVKQSSSSAIDLHCLWYPT